MPRQVTWPLTLINGLLPVLHRFQYFGLRNRFGELLSVSEKDGPVFAKGNSAREPL